MANDKIWRLDLPSKSSRDSSRSSSRRHRDEDKARPQQTGRLRDDDDGRQRSGESHRSLRSASNRYSDEESRRARPQQTGRLRDDDDGRQRSGESHRSRPEYREYQEYPEYAERRARNSGKLPPRTSGKLPPRYDDFDEPARTSAPTHRRPQYDEPERTSSPAWRRSQYDEPEKTRPSLWGDESAEQPALSPLWSGDALARREFSRWKGSTARAEGSQRNQWWRLPNFKDPSDRRRSLIWSTAVGLLIVCCVLPSLTFVGVFALYKHASSLATDGIAQLEQGGNLMKTLQHGKIEASVTSEALQSFQNAYADFSQLQTAVGLIPGSGGGLPKYGSEIASAKQLVPLAVEASQMAMLGTNALNILLAGVSNPFAKSGSGLTPAGMQTIDSDFQQVVALFNTLAGQIQQLSPASLTTFSPRLGADIVKVKAVLPTAQKYIQLADKVVTLLPSLLGVGTPTNYLIEVLDSTELRPGGGFFGNYGVLTLSGGREQGLKITDIDLLDRDKNNNPIVSNPFPPQYQWFATAEGQISWGMRDSNIEADFPTDARYAENMYNLEAQVSYQYLQRLHQNDPKDYPNQPTPPVQQFAGVIAITPYLIENMIDITGPITVPAPYNQTVTSTNMIDLIHYAQLGPHHLSDIKDAPGTTTSQRKAFTAALFKQLMAKVVSLATTKRADFVKLAQSALQSKDLQIYLGTAAQPSPGEALLEQFHDASDIQAPATGDSLMIVDANVAGNKQNEFIKFTATDDISIDDQGNAYHTLTLTYNWPYSPASSNNNYGGSNAFVYTDHVRIYVPPKALLASSYLASTNGTYGTWNPYPYPPEIGNTWDFGREVFSGDLNFNYPGQVSITFTWTVPNAAVQSGQTWKYQLLYQHQAGIPPAQYTQTTQITLPSCAKVTSLTKSLTKPKTGSGNTVTVSGPLTSDTTYAVEYTCAS